MENRFGKNLKYLREKSGMEQIELAKRLGKKSSSSISEWEKGVYTPKSGVLSDIAKIFRVNLHDLMNEDLSTHCYHDVTIQKSHPKQAMPEGGFHHKLGCAKLPYKPNESIFSHHSLFKAKRYGSVNRYFACARW